MPTPVTESNPEATRLPEPTPGATASSVHRSVVLFGGLRGVPIPSMDRYADSLLAELPAFGWPARLVRGPAWRLRGPGPVKFAAQEFSRHILYPRSARKERGDVYHVTDHSFGGLVDVLPHERTVVTCHDLIPWMCDIYVGRFKRAIGLSLFERSVRAMTRAAHIACDSTRTRNDVIDRLGIDPSRMSVVPIGVGEAFWPFPPEQRAKARDRLGFGDDVCVVLHTGSAAAYKNVESVISAVSSLRSRGIDCIFAKVGPLTELHRALITELGLDDYVRQFTGIADDVLCSIYNAADVLLFPSLYEGFGLPALEAMKVGLPVVISTAEALVEATGGIVPAVEPHDIVAMAEAMEGIWETRDSRESNTSVARLHAESLSWKRTAEAMAAIFDKVGSAAVASGA